MKIHAPKSWKEKQTVARGFQVFLPGDIEKIEVMSMRLEGLLTELDEVHRKLESLEIRVQERRAKNQRSTSLPREEEEAHLGSEYWIG